MELIFVIVLGSLLNSYKTFKNLFIFHVIPDFRERVNECMMKDPIRKYREQSRHSVVVSKQMWEIIPKTCRFRPTLNEVDEQIEGPWKVPDLEKRLHGGRRVFSCNLWRISVRNSTHVVRTENAHACEQKIGNTHISFKADFVFYKMLHIKLK